MSEIESKRAANMLVSVRQGEPSRPSRDVAVTASFQSGDRPLACNVGVKASEEYTILKDV